MGTSRSAAGSARSQSQPLDTSEVAAAVRRNGYSFVSGSRFGVGFTASADWESLAQAFDRLPADRYLRDGATFRERRYSRFRISEDGDLLDEPTAPYHQGIDVNHYAGGIDRVYEDLEPETRRNGALTSIVAIDAALFGMCYPSARAWRVDVHLFRILSQNSREGLPTPEGLHRDGNDGFAVHLVSRRCNGGVSRVCTTGGELLEERTLEADLDTLYANDHMVLHEVSPISPADDDIGIRDVMVVDFYIAEP